MKDDIEFYINENKLLNEEINNLKEQISNQAHDLVEMNILEKNLEKIKIEKEDLISKNKQLSEQLNKIKIEFQELYEQNEESHTAGHSAADHDGYSMEPASRRRTAAHRERRSRCVRFGHGKTDVSLPFGRSPASGRQHHDERSHLCAQRHL